MHSGRENIFLQHLTAIPSFLNDSLLCLLEARGVNGLRFNVAQTVTLKNYSQRRDAEPAILSAFFVSRKTIDHKIQSDRAMRGVVS